MVVSKLKNTIIVIGFILTVIALVALSIAPIIEYSKPKSVDIINIK